MHPHLVLILTTTVQLSSFPFLDSSVVLILSLLFHIILQVSYLLLLGCLHANRWKFWMICFLFKSFLVSVSLVSKNSLSILLIFVPCQRELPLLFASRSSSANRLVTRMLTLEQVSMSHPSDLTGALLLLKCLVELHRESVHNHSLSLHLNQLWEVGNLCFGSYASSLLHPYILVFLFSSCTKLSFSMESTEIMPGSSKSKTLCI